MDKIVAFICPFPWAAPNTDQRIPLFERDIPNTIKFWGSPVLLLAENIDIYLGQNTLPKLGPPYRPSGSSQREFQLYELPQPFLLSSDKNVKITTIENGKKLRCSFTFQGAIKPPHKIKGNIDKMDDDINSSSLLNLISSWVDIINEIIDSKFSDEQKKNLNRYTDTDYVHWEKIASLLLEEKHRQDEPRMALIVKIAKNMQEIIQQISGNPRKMLMRSNQIQRIEKIQEIGSNSLRWIARQPGRTIPEKGGTKQKIMAVVRISSFDTLENRVLKDFLKRSIEASFRYIKEHIRFEENAKSKRFRSVKKFNLLSKKILNAPFLNDVQTIESIVQPNYVLQSGHNYKELWEWYQRLIRQDYEIDNAWAWQSRLWSNIATFLISIVISGVSENKQIEVKPIAKSRALFMSEQICGSWLLTESVPGPCWFEYDNKVYIIETVNSSHAHNHSVCRHLGGTGGHLYVLITDSETQKKVVIVFWGIHGASTTILPDIKKVAESAASTIYDFYQDLSYHYTIPKMAGCVMISSMNHATTQAFEQYPKDNPKTKIYAIEFSASPQKWHDIIEYLQIFFIETLDLIK
ncbi:MAG: DUF2357 domain-containing protein [Desulfobacterales bacterium]|nr:DUF2357 domain-containing protein [Desulfobacterales bacterium]